MPYLEHDKRLHRLLPGEHVLGRGEGCAITIPSLPVGRHAAVRVKDREVTVRALGTDVPVRVNDEPVRSKTRPLAHGDVIRLGRVEVLYIDETQVGGTATAEQAAALEAAEEAAEAEVADYADAGGALTRRRDGARFPVAAPLYRIGREAGCDLVVPESTASRLHAEIRYEGGKYVLHDLSTNGTTVNGRRMGRTHVLERGDVVQIGSQQFEFFCETVPLTPAERARLEGSSKPPAAAEATTERVRPKRRGGLLLVLLLAAGATLAYFLL